MIIYNNFLYQYLNKTVDLTNDKFKLALFTSKYKPKLDDVTYSQISLSGAEVSGIGYLVGGKPITFTGPINIISDNNIYYKGSNVIWYDSTFANIRYAVIYRVSEEADQDILVSIHDFGLERRVVNGTLKISWEDEYILSLSMNSSTESSSGSVLADRYLSSESLNPLQNRSVTGSLGALGVRFEDEDIPDYAYELGKDIDTLAKISQEDIDSLING